MANIYFEVKSKEVITEDQAIATQHAFGKHPAGYGFYNFVVSVDDKGWYVAKWYCSDSSD